MRKTTNYFKIDGKPMLVPDAEVEMSYEDIDSSDAGRDESGVMHRVQLRSKVGAWNFTYSHLTEAEKNYMESLFGAKASFVFTHPSRQNAELTESCEAYRSKYAISWKNARTGLWSNYSFHIIEC